MAGQSSERITAAEYQDHEEDYLLYLFHLATYDFARPYVAGKHVLDFGCGSGYGCERIAPDCDSITGVDVSAGAIAYASASHPAGNLSFQAIRPVDDEPLPFPDAAFDTVLSFQVIEHVPDPDRYLEEVKRVLAPGGALVLATPDRVSRLFPRQRPWNRHHRLEYDAAQLETILRSHFPQVEITRMTADPKIVGVEVRRVRRLKLATLAFTFPGAPESWRQLGLGGLKALKRQPAKRKQNESATMGDAAPETPDTTAAKARFGYDETAVRIANDAAPSFNLICVASYR